MRRLALSLLAVPLIAAATPARAEFPEGVPDRFRLRAGVFFADLETELESGQLDAEILQLIDLEEDLDLPGTDDAFRIDGSWRIGRRTSLDFGYLEFSRSAEAAISRTITFEGFTFAATGLVRGSFDSVNPYMAIRYDFARASAFQLGASLGVDWFHLDAAVSGEGQVVGPDGRPVVGGIARDASVSVPAPVLGIQVEVAVARTVTLGAYARAISLAVDEAEGHLFDAAVRAEWFALRNLGLGASYDWTELELDRLESDDFEYAFRYTYRGPRAFLVVTF